MAPKQNMHLITTFHENSKKGGFLRKKRFLLINDVIITVPF